MNNNRKSKIKIMVESAWYPCAILYLLFRHLYEIMSRPQLRSQKIHFFLEKCTKNAYFVDKISFQMFLRLKVKETTKFILKISSDFFFHEKKIRVVVLKVVFLSNFWSFARTLILKVDLHITRFSYLYLTILLGTGFKSYTGPY
jgi:hypothetical protein